MDTQLQRLTELLEDSLALCKDNRDLAVDHYDKLRGQLDHILEIGMETSEESRLEHELGIAIKLVTESGKRLDNVIMTISKLIVTQLNADSRERVARTLVGKSNQGIIDEPINMTQLLEEKTNDDRQ